MIGSAQPAILAIAVLAVGAGLVVGLKNWRWSIYGLLAYIPVSGIAILFAYGHSRSERAVAVLAKDFVFVIPAYVGFLWSSFRTRTAPWFRGAPLVLFGLLALVVVVQAFNPKLPNHLVGIIGIKIWLFYVPLFFLGYFLVRSREQLFPLLGFMGVLAVVPAVVGLATAILYWAGESAFVYRIYGDAAAPATQNYQVFLLPGGCTLRRVPSTFSFFYQYYFFLAAMLAVSYAWWRGSRPAGRQLLIGGGLFVLLLAAIFTRGLRGAFVFVPPLVLGILGLSWRSPNRIPLMACAIGLAGFAAAAAIMGTAVCGLTGHIRETLTRETPDVITGSVATAVHKTWLGLGAGSDSVGARYAFPDVQLQTQPQGTEESWYVKTYLELGVFGLLIVLALLLVLLFRLARAHLQVRDAQLKVVSGAFVALLFWMVLYGVKGQYVDIDPMNVYFWLFAGIVMKVAVLDATPEALGPEPERGDLVDRVAVPS